MESSSLFNCAVSAKDEPTIDVSLSEKNCDIVDEKLDFKNFQLLPFLHENSSHAIRKCNKKDSEVGDEVEIVVECEDVKPNINSLKVAKIEDDSRNYLRNVKNNDDYRTQNIIKIEPAVEVKQEIVAYNAEESNLNLDCELVEQYNKKRITKMLNNKRKPCNWDICEKSFTQKGYLKTNVDSVHKADKRTCDKCGKTFSQKSYLQIHIDSEHKKITHACDTRAKTFTQKSNLKIHIDVEHNRKTYACDVCQKKFRYTQVLKTT
ncbi:zinc finger protein 214-like isoform X2 [Trichogramma pretiosum]|uniref:zinc finger protein 214-like isoform X2 n=1 Tax=Trichogramma pretiosum TaxID=7493 RepID=UPI0006C97A69|nr:zinc finger protein 214-like isoform X2 [Trichogramma pretiosum]